MRIHVNEFFDSKARFHLGQRFEVDSVEYGAGGHSLARVYLTALDEPVEPEPQPVSAEMRAWLAAALKQYPLARAHPEYITGYDERTIMGSAALLHEFGGGPGMNWVIPPEDDIPQLVAEWTPPIRPD